MSSLRYIFGFSAASNVFYSVWLHSGRKVLLAILKKMAATRRLKKKISLPIKAGFIISEISACIVLLMVPDYFAM